MGNKKWQHELREGAISYPLFDHAIFKKDRVILQSYPACLCHFEKLIAFCVKRRLDFTVESKSMHSDECFTITIEEEPIPNTAAELIPKTAAELLRE